MATTHEERKKALEQAEATSILDVAQELGMSLTKSGRTYTWDDHDSLVITPSKNMFYWNSRQVGGGVIQLVQQVKECTKREAVEFINRSDLTEFVPQEETKQAFHYFMAEHEDMTSTKDYLIKERQLSEETVNFFIDQGVIAQGTYRNKETNHEETAIVFKHKDLDGSVKGISLQGTQPFPDEHEGGGMLKRTYGDGFYGMSVSVGQPPTVESLSKDTPLRLFAFESPIDLMSYYELHKESIGDAVLLSMNGLRKGTISTYLANALQTRLPEDKKSDYLNVLNTKTTQSTSSIQVTLCVDNDEAGKRFVNQFNVSVIDTHSSLPPIKEGQQKSDWNDYLKEKKGASLMTKQTIPYNVTLNQATETVLSQTFDTMSAYPEGTHRYLTEQDVSTLLDEHLAKVDHLLNHFTSSYNQLDQPTKEDAKQLNDGLEETITMTVKEFEDKLKEALETPKPTKLTQVKESTQHLKIKVMNTYKRPLLYLSQQVHDFSKKLIDRFALQELPPTKQVTEDKIVTPTEEKNSPIQDNSMTVDELVTKRDDLIKQRDEWAKHPEFLQTKGDSQNGKTPLTHYKDLQKEINELTSQIKSDRSNHKQPSNKFEERIQQARHQTKQAESSSRDMTQEQTATKSL